MSQDFEDAEGRQEIVFDPDSESGSFYAVTEEDHRAAIVVKANADVTRACGFSIAFTPPLMVLFVFLEAIIRNHDMVFDVRLILAICGAYGMLAAFYFRGRSNK